MLIKKFVTHSIANSKSRISDETVVLTERRIDNKTRSSLTNNLMLSSSPEKRDTVSIQRRRPRAWACLVQRRAIARRLPLPPTRTPGSVSDWAARRPPRAQRRTRRENSRPRQWCQQLSPANRIKRQNAQREHSNAQRTRTTGTAGCHMISPLDRSSNEPRSPSET